MKRFIAYFICTAICILIILIKDRIHKWIEPYMEKYVWKYIPYGIGYPVFMFIILAIVKYTATSSDVDFANQMYIGGIIVYFLFTFYVVYELMEKFGIYVSRKMSISKLIFQILLSLISIVLCFGFAYNALYYYDSSMFSSVISEGIFKDALQFSYYSFEIMFNTDVSDIRAENYFSQGITIIESLTSFIIIVILIANYENIGKLFKERRK